MLDIFLLNIKECFTCIILKNYQFYTILKAQSHAKQKMFILSVKTKINGVSNQNIRLVFHFILIFDKQLNSCLRLEICGF